MKLNAVGVSSRNLQRTVDFYSLLGFSFPTLKAGEGHVESVSKDGIKLMIDTIELVKSIIGEDPRPGNHSQFAILYDSAEKVDAIAAKLRNGGFKIVKEPWDAFWGQRYAIVEDPDGYKVDLYAYL